MWIVLSAVLLIADGPQQQPPSSPVATAAVSGTVTASDTGRPARRVRVSLRNIATDVNMGTVATDLQGRFAFSDLPAGAYTLKAAKSGYLEVVYGQEKPGSGRAGTPIQLAEGQKIERLAVVLPRGGVISGMVLDEVGDPAWNIPVRAMKWVMRNGVRELQSVPLQVLTDDRGHYRIASLTPGDYIVCAVPRDELTQALATYDEIKSRSPQFLAGSAAQTGANAAERQAMAARMAAAQGPRPEEPTEAYVQICAPGTAQLTAAAVIPVDVGQERAGNVLQLQLLPISTISGTVTWSGGAIPVGNTLSDATTVWLVQQQSVSNSVNSPGGQRVVHAAADGRFSFATVMPGNYTLTARAETRERAGETGGAGQPPALPSVTPLWASVDVTVSGQVISDLLLSLEPGVSVTGRVVAEGSPPVDVSRIRLTARQSGPFAGEMAPVITTIDAEGRFTLRSVVPGRYKITTYSTGSIAGTPGAGAIKSSVFNGADTLDFPIEIKGDTQIADVVVTMIPQLAEITGLVHDASGKPAVGFTVVVFAADTRYWTPDSRRLQGIRPGTDGRFSIKNLPAGEYRIAAVTDVESGQWFEQDFLRQLVAVSATLTLGDGQRLERTLRVK